MFKPPVLDAVTLEYIRKSMPAEEFERADAEGCFDLLKALDKSRLHPKKVVVHGKKGDFISTRMVKNDELKAPQASKPSFNPFDKLDAKLKRDRINRMNEKGAKPGTKSEAKPKPEDKPKPKPESKPKPQAKPEPEVKKKSKKFPKKMQELYDLMADKLDTLSADTIVENVMDLKTAKEKYDYLSRSVARNFLDENQMRRFAGLRAKKEKPEPKPETKPAPKPESKSKPKPEDTPKPESKPKPEKLTELLSRKLYEYDLVDVTNILLEKETTQKRYDYLCRALDGMLTDEQMREIAGAEPSEKLVKPAQSVIELQQKLQKMSHSYWMGEITISDFLNAGTPEERYNALKQSLPSVFTEDQLRYYAGMPARTSEERFAAGGISKSFQKDLADRFETATEDVRKAFDKYAVEVSQCLVSTTANRGGYSPHEDKIKINAKTDSVPGALGIPVGSTLFHELGHLIDYRAARRMGIDGDRMTISQDEKFLKAIRADVKAAERAMKKQMESQLGRKVPIHKVRFALCAEMMKDGKGMTAGIQDIYGGTVRGRYPGAICYHSKSEWDGDIKLYGRVLYRGMPNDRDRILGTESFANMYAASSNKTETALMEKWFPTAFTRFRELLAEAANN